MVLTFSKVKDLRIRKLQTWLLTVLKAPVERYEALPGDASFRRYYRVWDKKNSYIVMDCPPAHGSCTVFIKIANKFRELGVCVPTIYAEDIESGFLLLSDFGDRRYIDVLNNKTADSLYLQALNTLFHIQSCKKTKDYIWPQFDSFLYEEEMRLFEEWYLDRHLKLSLSQSEKKILDTIYPCLSASALEQPQTCVHRDYHSRNLMFMGEESPPGVLDFQDALWGPITYDLVSLLQDCYIEWPVAQIQLWISWYQRQSEACGRWPNVELQTFMRWFDYMGLQRGLKCIGIFARLSERDQKPHYLPYIPRILRYAERVCGQYEELSELKCLLQKGVS